MHTFIMSNLHTDGQYLTVDFSGLSGDRGLKVGMGGFYLAANGTIHQRKIT